MIRFPSIYFQLWRHGKVWKFNTSQFHKKLLNKSQGKWYIGFQIFENQFSNTPTHLLPTNVINPRMSILSVKPILKNRLPETKSNDAILINPKPYKSIRFGFIKYSLIDDIRGLFWIFQSGWRGQWISEQLRPTVARFQDQTVVKIYE